MQGWAKAAAVPAAGRCTTCVVAWWPLGRGSAAAAGLDHVAGGHSRQQSLCSRTNSPRSAARPSSSLTSQATSMPPWFSPGSA